MHSHPVCMTGPISTSRSLIDPVKDSMLVAGSTDPELSVSAAMHRRVKSKAHLDHGYSTGDPRGQLHAEA